VLRCFEAAPVERGEPSTSATATTTAIGNSRAILCMFPTSVASVEPLHLIGCLPRRRYLCRSTARSS
jgi:hypothetical protein